MFDRLKDILLGRKSDPGNVPLGGIVMSENPIKQQAISDVLAQYLGQVPDEPYAQGIIGKLGADAVTQGIKQGLNFGVPEIAQWQNQYNASAENPIKIPQNDQEIALARQGNFNTNLAGDIQEQARNNVWDNFINGAKDLQAGFRENANTPFKVDNLSYKEKSIPTRIGEGLGTMGRFATSPLGRGLIVGGIVGATGGSPLQAATYGSTTAVNNQLNRTKDALYRQKLKDMGYTQDQINDMGGYIDNDTFKNLSDGQYKLSYGQYRNRKLDQDSYLKLKKYYDDQLKLGVLDPVNYQMNLKALNDRFINDNIATADIGQVQESNDTRKTDSTIGLNKIRGNTMQQNANSNAVRAGAYAENVKNYGKKPENNPNYGQALAQYMAVKDSGDKEKAAWGRRKFMEDFNVDPEKKLKTDSEILQFLRD